MQRSPITKPPFFQGPLKVLQGPGFWILFFCLFFSPEPPSPLVGELKGSILRSRMRHLARFEPLDRRTERRSKIPRLRLLRLLFFLPSLVLWLREFEGIENRALAHQIRQQLQFQICKKIIWVRFFWGVLVGNHPFVEICRSSSVKSTKHKN